MLKEGCPILGHPFLIKSRVHFHFRLREKSFYRSEPLPNHPRSLREYHTL